MKIRDRQVMQVCHRGRNKQRDCDRKSRRVMGRESGRHRHKEIVERIIICTAVKSFPYPAANEHKSLLRLTIDGKKL